MAFPNAHAQKDEEKLLMSLRPKPTKSKAFQPKQQSPTLSQKLCVYCDSSEHRSVVCSKITSTLDRKRLLSDYHLCFNCTSRDHRTSQCTSRLVCKTCKAGHHTSTCDKKSDAASSENFMSAHDKNSCVTYPVVGVEVNGIRCRAILDTEAGSSYISASLLSELKANPYRKEDKRIEMMPGSTSKLISVYGLNIKSVERKFDLKAEVTGVDRDVLLTLYNPRYQEIMKKYTHLRDLEMTDRDETSNLPVNIILGTLVIFKYYLTVLGTSYTPA